MQKKKNKKLKIAVHNLQKKHRVSTTRLRKDLEKAGVLLKKEIPGDLEELNVYLATVGRIAKIHGQFLKDPTPTDVITFEHGEIFICPAVAEKQRKDTGLSLYQEILTYAVHGMLHLCGWEDHGKRAFEAMKRKQAAIVRKICKSAS